MDTSSSFTLADFIKSFGPLITAGATISVFYLTTRRDRRKEQKKSLQEKLNKVRYVSYITDDVIKLVDKQAQALQQHIVMVKAQRFDAVPLVHYNKRSCELLSNLMTDELTFSAFVGTPMANKVDMIQTFSKISSKAVFINALFDLILADTKSNFDYIHEQAKLIQTEIDGLLRAVNSLALSLQTSGSTIDVDRHFVAKVKTIDESLYSQQTQGLETFYHYLVVALRTVVSDCKTKDFSNIDALLNVARFRDRAERMYNELFGTHQDYLQELDEQTKLLKGECQELQTLMLNIKPLEV